MSDGGPLWGWIIKGLGGIVSLAVRLGDDGVPISEHWLGELDKELVKLRELAERLWRKSGLK